MEVKFDLVRIGQKRKNHLAEILLRENTELLMDAMRNFLMNLGNADGLDKEEVTIVVPGKGCQPRFRLQDFRDIRIRGLVKNKFSEFIYKGTLNTILDNAHNRVFR